MFVQFEDPVLIKFITKNLLLLVFISVLDLIFIKSLSDVPAFHFHFRLIFLCISCLQKNDGPFLMP